MPRWRANPPHGNATGPEDEGRLNVLTEPIDITPALSTDTEQTVQSFQHPEESPNVDYDTVRVIDIPMPTASSHVAGNTADTASTATDKRKLSLEALFQAAHSELENISKGKEPSKASDPGKEPVISMEDEDPSRERGETGKREMVTVIEVPQLESPEGASFLINTGGSGGTLVQQLKQVVGSKDGATLYSISDGPSSQVLVQNSAGLSYQVKSDGFLQQSEGPNIFLNRAQSLDDTILDKSKPSGSTPTVLMLTPSTSIGAGGRKRKHPQKPGKHICPYCNRGCAKPSVLKKHIRAHTGERPYPCTTCGFAFKTKSNLYKHCKSRWHQLKLGLKEGQGSSSKLLAKGLSLGAESLDQEADEDDEDDEDDEEDEDDEGQLLIDSSVAVPELSIRAESGTRLQHLLARDSKSLDFSGSQSHVKKALKRYKSELDTRKRKKSRVSTVDEEKDALKKLQSFRLQTGGTVISRPADKPEVTLSGVVAEKNIQEGISTLLPRPETPVAMETSTPSIVLSSVQSIEDSAKVKMETVSLSVPKSFTAFPENLFMLPNTSLPTVTVSVVSTGTVTMATQPSMSPIQLPLKVTPAVVPARVNQSARTITQRTMLAKSYTTGDDPASQPPKIQNFSRSASLQAGGISMESSMQKNKIERPSLSAEKVMERISNLISLNQTIISTPMAEPPRKRVLRQASMSMSQLGVPQSIGSLHGNPLIRSASMTDRLVQIAPMPLEHYNPAVALSRSMSVQTLPTIITSPPIPVEPTVPLQMTEGTPEVPKPVIQLPPHFLSPSPSVPRQIKIQFKLPKDSGGSPVKTLAQGKSMESPYTQENIVREEIPAQPSEAIEQRSVYKAPQPEKQADISTIAKTRPQLAAILQGHDAQSSQGTNAQLPHHAIQAPEMPKYVCGTCWQMYNSIDLLQNHTCQPSSQKPAEMSTVEVTDIPNVEASPDVETVVEDEIVITPAAVTKASLTTASPRPKRVLQRQKNVIVEMVDPRVAPRRGRPKGARNMKDLRLESPKRPPLMRSQSTIEPSKKGSVPGEGKAETPTALWKLKLKGHLLMKRSMSVERMLSQEKEQQENQRLSNLEIKPESGPLAKSRQAMLLRSKSYDETVFSGQKAPQDRQVREKLLSKLSRSCLNLTRSGSLEIEEDVEEKGLDKGEPMDAESEIETAISKIVTQVSPISKFDAVPAQGCFSMFISSYEVLNLPTNKAMKLQQPSWPIFTPQLLIKKLGIPMELPVPVTLSIPVSIAHKVPGLLHEAKLCLPETESTPMEPGAITHEIVSMESENTEEPDTADPAKVCCASLTSEAEAAVKSSPPSPTSGQTPAVSNSENTEEASPKKKNVCTLHTIQMAGSSKQVRNKIAATLILLGHTYPSMKTNTMPTFCCIHKTQPMYVEKRSNHNVSMYSNWRAAPYNPNPKGLDSKDLLDLYQTQRYECQPRFAISGNKSSPEFTHSNYWVSREDEFEHEEPGLTESQQLENASARKVRETIKPEIYPDVILSPEKEPVESEQAIAATMPDVPTISTARDRLKEALIDKPKRIQIFDGGYKSLEDYTYIRGRGRGRYVCEKCGIRCKKPSMLKKHIRTHTDIRPYHCRHCNFSFKTKGNLTKHMKSKSHHKLCVDLGIFPVPTYVDDNCIVSDVSGDGMMYDMDGQVVAHTEEVGDEDDEDDDDDGDDEDFEDNGEDDEDEEQLGDRSSVEVNPEMLEVEVISHPTKEISAQELQNLDDTPTEKSGDSSGEQTVAGAPSASLDKEIAAASLLDLSKVAGSKVTRSKVAGPKEAPADDEASDDKSEETTNADQSSQNLEMEVDPADETSGSEMSESLEGNDTSDDPVTTRDIIVQSTFKYLISNSSYAKKIAMLQAANSTDAGQPSSSEFSGFVPPLMFRSGDPQMAPVQSQEVVKKAGIEDPSSSKWGPIVGQFILPDFKAEASTKDSGKGSHAAGSNVGSGASLGATSIVIRLDDIPTSSELTGELRRQITALKRDPLIKSKILQDLKVQYVDSEDHAPCEILPIPVGSGEDPAGKREADGKYVCSTCRKTFDKPHLLTMHKNIHLLEKPYRCTDCAIAFQSRMLLDKHQTSDRHQQQVAMLQKLGAPTSEDPRPFKCEECNIAFRIHGHLARHLRSKMHISKLEAMGKVPIGTYDQVEYGPSHSATSIATAVTPTKPQNVKLPTINMTLANAKAVKKLAEQSHEVQVSVDDVMTKTLSVEPATVPETSPVRLAVTQAPQTESHHASLSSHDGSFLYQATEEYEKVDLASNERVTVEIKSEPIEFGQIVPKVSQKRDEPEMDPDKDAEGASSDGPNKCGICAKRFKDMVYLKRHLVSHAELRPYVCEYCDAGFTTSQSLKFHLRTHTQACPYICGHCGATFGRSDHLQLHYNKEHCGGMMDDIQHSPAEKPPEPIAIVSIASPTKSMRVPGDPVGSASIRHAIQNPMFSASVDTRHVLRALTTNQHLLSTSLPSQLGASLLQQHLQSQSPIQGHQQNQVQFVFVNSASAQETVAGVQSSDLSSQGLQESMTYEDHELTEVEVVDKEADNDLSIMTEVPPPEDSGDTAVPSSAMSSAEFGAADEDIIELDLNNYDVQECIEQGPDGEQRIIYMLVTPDRVVQTDSSNADEHGAKFDEIEADTNSQDIVPADHLSGDRVHSGDSVLESHSYVAKFGGQPEDTADETETNSAPLDEHYAHCGEEPETERVKVMFPNVDTSQGVIVEQFQGQLSGHIEDKVDLPGIHSVSDDEVDEPPRKWRVIEGAEGTMSLSPIFDNEEGVDGPSHSETAPS